MTVQELIDQNTAKLPQSSTPRLDVLVLLEAASGQNQAHILASCNQEVSDLLDQKQQSVFAEFITKRARFEPVAYILNSVEFYGLSFYVDEHVMIPRPETEKLVDYISRQAPQNTKVLDIGTGSGCIAIATKYSRPDLIVSASDISKPALEIAKNNAKENNTDIDFINSDLLVNITSNFNIYVANLPYIPKDYPCSKEVSFEPQTAIFSKNRGLEHIQKLLKQLSNRLAPGNLVILEAFPKQHPDIADFAKSYGLKRILSDDFLLVLELS